MFVPTHCQHIWKPNESYAKGKVPGLNQESGRMVKWDTSAISCAVVSSQGKRTKGRNNVNMTKGRYNRKSLLK